MNRRCEFFNDGKLSCLWWVGGCYFFPIALPVTLASYQTDDDLPNLDRTDG